MKSKKFKNGRDVITTSSAREQVQLRAAGYQEVPMNHPNNEAVPESPKPDSKPNK